MATLHRVPTVVRHYARREDLKLNRYRQPSGLERLTALIAYGLVAVVSVYFAWQMLGRPGL